MDLKCTLVAYIYAQKTVRASGKLEYICLPDEINLSKEEFACFYKSASVRISGKKPGTFITKIGTPIIYSLTIPKNAPNPETAKKFLTFVLDVDKGGAILTKNGQGVVGPLLTEASCETDDLETLGISKKLRQK